MTQEGHTAGSMMETQDETRTLLTGEILAFGLLGRTFYAYPEAAWVEALSDSLVIVDALQVGAFIARAVRTAKEEALGWITALAAQTLQAQQVRHGVLSPGAIPHTVSRG